MTQISIFLIAAAIIFIIVFAKREFRRKAILEAGAYGESIVRDALSTLKGAHVVHNVTVTHGNRKGEIDHIVYKDGMIAFVETKNYSGHITGSEHDVAWVRTKTSRGGQQFTNTVRNPCSQVKRVISISRNILREHGLSPWIEPVVVMAGDCTLDISGSTTTIAASPLELPEKLSNMSNQKHFISKSMFTRIVQALKNSSYENGLDIAA